VVLNFLEHALQGLLKKRFGTASVDSKQAKLFSSTLEAAVPTQTRLIYFVLTFFFFLAMTATWHVRPLL
jgi:hypothetical protein